MHQLIRLAVPPGESCNAERCPQPAAGMQEIGIRGAAISL